MTSTSIGNLNSLSSLLDSSKLLQKKGSKDKDDSNSLTDLSSQFESMLSSLGASQGSKLLDLQIEQSASEFSITGDGFAAKGASQSFGLSATFQQGDYLVEVNLQMTQSVIGVAVGGSGQDLDSLLNDALSKLPDDIKDKISGFFGGFGKDVGTDSFASFFTPDKVANRIADFALGGYGTYGGSAGQEDTVENRQRYADYILPAIDKGYNEALAILGKLPDKVSGELQQTRDLIQQRFDNFINKDSLDSAA